MKSFKEWARERYTIVHGLHPHDLITIISAYLAEAGVGLVDLERGPGATGHTLRTMPSSIRSIEDVEAARERGRQAREDVSKAPEPEVTEEMRDRGAVYVRSHADGRICAERTYRAMRALEPKRPVEISEEMVERALAVFFSLPTTRDFFNSDMRAALQAALNGEETR